MKRLVVQNKETGCRSRVIVFNHCQWESINNRVSKTVDQAIEAAAIAMERENRRQRSIEMASAWENTFANLRKIRFQQRQERIKNEEADIEEKYKAMKKEQKEIQQEIKKKAKEILFEQKNSTKTLRSAQKLCQVYKEREIQMNFEKILKAQKRQDEEDEIKRMYEDIALFNKEEDEKKQKALEEKLKKQKEFTALLKEIEENKRKEKEYTYTVGKEELRLMKEEIDQIHKYEQEELERKKNLCLQYMEDGMKYYKKYEASRLEDEKEEEKAIELVARGKVQIAQQRKNKEDDNLRIKLEKIDNVVQILINATKHKDDKEEENYEKAVAEKDAIFEQNEAARIEKADQLRRERIEAHLAYLKEEAETKEQQHELFKWAVLQRLKNEEVNHSLRLELKRNKLKRILLCQEANRKLTKEFNEKIAREKQEDVDAVKRAIDLWLLEDKEFLEFAQKIREECKEKGQTVYPIDTAIHKYKIENGLMRLKRGIGLVESPQQYPLDVEIERTPPKNKAGLALLNEIKRKAEIEKRGGDPRLKSIEKSLNECLCVKPGGNGLDFNPKKK